MLLHSWFTLVESLPPQLSDLSPLLEPLMPPSLVPVIKDNLKERGDVEKQKDKDLLVYS